MGNASHMILLTDPLLEQKDHSQESSFTTTAEREREGVLFARQLKSQIGGIKYASRKRADLFTKTTQKISTALYVVM